MKKIIDIIEPIANEKGLSVEDITEALTDALINTAKKIFGAEYEYGVDINSKEKDLKLYQKVLVVKDDDDRLLNEEDENFVSLKDAKEIDSDLELGDELTYPLSLENMGRTAASTLYRELEFHIQRRVEQDMLQKYQSKIGKRVSGTVVRVDDAETTFIEIGAIKALMPQKLRIKGEKFKVGDVVRGIIKSVFIDRFGFQVEISRTSPKFLEELLALEVPEIKDEIITIHKSARIPGVRAKVALSSSDPRIDAIGSTVGNRGIRIMSVCNELNRENIDCIEYSSIPEIFVARSLSPAIVSNVKIVKDGREEKALVTIPVDQKSKAIGKEGINIRLASMLCGFKIELLEEASSGSDSSDVGAKSGENTLASLFGDS